MTLTVPNFVQMPSGEYHWSVHYHASSQSGSAPVYTYRGERVTAESIRVRRGRGRGQLMFVVRPVDGAPRDLGPALTLTDFRKQCVPTGLSLRDTVFAGCKQVKS